MKPKNKQIIFQMPVLANPYKPGSRIVGNFNIAYDLASGEIEFVTFGEDKVKTRLEELIPAIAPEMWCEIWDAVISNREIELEAAENMPEEDER